MSKLKKNSDFPRISIITPSFNQGQFIKQTIDSILDQNYPNLEYIVMDAGSTDQTVKILKSYGKKIDWVSKKDKGQADAINKGLKKTSGEIISYINADDVVLPGTLQKVANYFTSHSDARWLTGDYNIIDENGKKIQSWIVLYKKFFRSFPYLNTLSVVNFIIQPSTYWRRSLVDEIGYFNEKLHLCLDYDYWMRAILKYPLHVLPNKLSAFRIHGDSKGVNDFKFQFNQEHQLVKKYVSNPLIRLLHLVHSRLIIIIYNLIK